MANSEWWRLAPKDLTLVATASTNVCTVQHISPRGELNINFTQGLPQTVMEEKGKLGNAEMNEENKPGHVLDVINYLRTGSPVFYNQVQVRIDVFHVESVGFPTQKATKVLMQVKRAASTLSRISSMVAMCSVRNPKVPLFVKINKGGLRGLATDPGPPLIIFL